VRAGQGEGVATPQFRSGTKCWGNGHRTDITAHDGRFGGDHPAVRNALMRTQSATSLRLLLRSPLGFVWKSALGWWSPEEVEQPLTIAPDDLGKLVHEVLRRAVDALERGPG